MRPVSALLALLLCAAAQNAYPAGFATRDLNPILQSIFLPTLVPVGEKDGWRMDHSLYITNTMQAEDSGGESLVIDVENYRYELSLAGRQDRWIGRIAIPLVANSAGELDALIEDWHDFFGFPQGKRDEFPRDQLAIEYSRDGAILYSQTESASGIGDLSLALGYQVTDQTAWFFGVELPTGSEQDFSGNEATDFALWVTHVKHYDERINLFGMLGVSFPGDGGHLEGLVAERIWAAQLGFDILFLESLVATLQLDLHSQTIEDSDLDAFGNSAQVQVGLGFIDLFEGHRLDLFFSEDILVGTAPDISFSLRYAVDL